MLPQCSHDEDAGRAKRREGGRTDCDLFRFCCEGRNSYSEGRDDGERERGRSSEKVV